MTRPPPKRPTGVQIVECNELARLTETPVVRLDRGTALSEAAHKAPNLAERDHLTRLAARLNARRSR